MESLRRTKIHGSSEQANAMDTLSRSELSRITTRMRTGSIQRLGKASLQRHDIRAWCIWATFISILTSVTAVILGSLIVVHEQPMPEFLKDKCTTTNLLTMPTAGIPVYVPQHFAVPSTAAGSMMLVLMANITLTALLDVHSRVAETGLLWSLVKENGVGPRYNTNSRLLSGTKRFGMNAKRR
jgi:hypothetical protein